MYELQRILFTAPTETQQMGVKEMCLAGLSNNWTRHGDVALKGINAIARAFIQAPVVCIRGIKSSFIHLIHGDPKLALKTMSEDFGKGARSLTQIIVIVSSIMLGTLFPQTIYRRLLACNEKRELETSKEENLLNQVKDLNEQLAAAKKKHEESNIENEILSKRINDLDEKLKKQDQIEVKLTESTALFYEVQTILKALKEENDKLKEDLNRINNELNITKDELKETQKIELESRKKSQLLLEEKNKEIAFQKKQLEAALKLNLNNAKVLENFKSLVQKSRQENTQLKEQIKDSKVPRSTPLTALVSSENLRPK